MTSNNHSQNTIYLRFHVSTRKGSNNEFLQQAWCARHKIADAVLRAMNQEKTWTGFESISTAAAVGDEYLRSILVAVEPSKGQKELDSKQIENIRTAVLRADLSYGTDGAQTLDGEEIDVTVGDEAPPGPCGICPPDFICVTYPDGTYGPWIPAS